MGLYPTLLLITTLLLCIGSATSLSAQRSCPSSYCGNLQISYPFRLKGDKPTCGDRRYELTCEGNRAIIDIDSGKYCVKSISYSKGDERILITDVNFAGGGCALPSGTLSLDTISHDERFIFSDKRIRTASTPLDENLTEAIFVNCTREIFKQNSDEVGFNLYSQVPCVSRSKALVYVIVSQIDERVAVQDFPPSCRYLAMVLLNGSYQKMPETDENVIWYLQNPDENVFQYLQNGISLRWANPSCDPLPMVVKNCHAVAWEGQYYVTFEDESNEYVHGRPLFSYLANPVYQTSFFSCLDYGQDCLFNSVFILLIKGFIVLMDALLFITLTRILVRLILSILAVLALLVYKYHKMRVPTDAVEKFLIDQQSLTPTRYAYTDIIMMTKNFKDKIGQGGFGSVYKGKLLSGFQVAIKILGNSKCNGDDFISEVSTIGTIHHINIVRLVGFCSEGSKRALVYEYLPKGSLDKYIFSSETASQRPFTMEKLIDIALGIARGIDYLHRGCNMRILHFDIKPPNILLDNSFNPKVSDFGLAKLFPKDYSLVALSAARGTIGYIAPELVSRSFGIISYKSDVYSFGMLLMEMAGGRRNVEPKAENTSQLYYPSWIYDQLDDQRDMHGIVRDVAPIGEIERKLSIVGLWCIQTRPSERPSMSRVIEMLQAEVGTLQMPPKPFLSAGRVCSMPIRDPSMEASSSTLTAISEQESLT